MVEQRGVEPLTSALRTRRSAKLSYCPTRSAILGTRLSSVKRRPATRRRGRSLRAASLQSSRRPGPCRVCRHHARQPSHTRRARGRSCRPAHQPNAQIPSEPCPHRVNRARRLFASSRSVHGPTSSRTQHHVLQTRAPRFVFHLNSCAPPTTTSPLQLQPPLPRTGERVDAVPCSPQPCAPRVAEHHLFQC